jgi:hypothetical protein
MNEIDPNILELAKKDFGDNCELVRKTDWSYSFKCGPKSYSSISRFMAEKGFEVSATEIRQQWQQWDQRQRMDFAFNWQAKGTWTDDDTEILETIMSDGDDDVWQSWSSAACKSIKASRELPSRSCDVTSCKAGFVSSERSERSGSVWRQTIRHSSRTFLWLKN